MNIKDNHDCYGCGVCAAACPKKIISIKLNQEGFYEPYIIDEDQCVDCSICFDVCSYNYDETSEKTKVIQAFAGWSNNSETRKKCSSGGVAYEIAVNAIKQGFAFCGVLYNARKNRAEHYITDSIDSLTQSIGSKYIQSYTVDAFKELGNKGDFLVVGTPCQIDSLRRFIKKKKIEDHFILVDIYCHGVTSMNVWTKYTRKIEAEVGKIEAASWRNKHVFANDNHNISEVKPVDWHDSYNIIIKGEKGIYQKKASKGDVFFQYFLKEDCLGKSCYSKCKYRYDKSSADIRIGDCWGDYFQDDKKGVNSVVIFSQKGKDFLQNCDCTFQELPFSIVAQGQMKKPSSIKQRRNKVFRLLGDPNSSIDDVTASLQKTRRREYIAHQLLTHPIRTILEFIKKH